MNKYAMFVSADLVEAEPKSLNETLNSAQQESWQKAMEAEDNYL